MPYFGDIICKLKDYVEGQREIKRIVVRKELAECLGIDENSMLSRTLALQLIPRIK